jgi:hypothetical protein
MRRRIRSGVGAALVALLLVGSTACDEAKVGAADSAASLTPVSPAPDSSASRESSALAALETLTIKGRAPKTGYSRDQFGPGWASAQGCDTRNRILDRDLVDKTYRPGNCVVLTGTLLDPYTGKTIAFERGNGTSTAVQIDHVVSLSDSWQKGAFQWAPDKRVRFANDPLNLLAVDGHANQQKSDADAATWLPPNKPFRCQFVARQVAVKAKYNVWVTQAEHDAIARVLQACPNEPVPTG